MLHKFRNKKFNIKRKQEKVQLTSFLSIILGDRNYQKLSY
ncbi:unnamed protein product [Paramecium sonneborni]|uniref:Uncharacterized protein n=1 Tax=Paramecium sonneborni TaxID=65129 RepID=A0A8S1PHX1_9CILI|nr:unnamed protein product [Paramecium sonneborni]